MVVEYLAIKLVAQKAIKVASFLKALGYNGTDLALIQIYIDSANVLSSHQGRATGAKRALYGYQAL